jgi:hypothetical protein
VNGFAVSLGIQEQRTLENGEMVEQINVPVYFPGTTDAGSASPIEVTAGSNITGMDFILVDPVPARHVRGIVMNGDTSQPAGDTEVTIVPQALTHDAVISTVRTDKNGAFDISGITTGSYILSTSFGEGRALTGYVPIEVGGDDLNGITLNLSRGYDVSGRLVLGGGNSNFTPPISALIPTVERQPFALLPPPQPSGVPRPSVAEDGSFVIKSLAPGDYRVFVTQFGSNPIPDTFYFKSIRLGTSDVLADGLHIEGTPNAELEIVLGTDVATVHGSVVNQKQEPMPNAVVAMVPYPIGSGRAYLYKNGATDLSGQFEFRGVAPGDYMVFAWEDVEFGAWQDPEFTRSYENVGKRVHVSEAASETVELRIFQ